MFLVSINLSKKIFVKFLPKNNWDKDDFHPSKDAALLYSSLDGLHDPHGLVFMQYSFLYTSMEHLFV
jgi:hypothetical protein